MILVSCFQKLRPVGWFLPGFLLYAAFPPMCEASDVLFAFFPLMILSRHAEPSVSAKRWFQSGLFFWVATLSWMPAIIKNGGPWPLVLLGWGALSVYCALYFAAYGFLSAVYWRSVARSDSLSLARRLVGVLLVEPLLWAGLELVRSRLFGGFSWNQAGVVLANSNFGRPASLGGVYLLSAVVILVNGTFAGIGERLWESVCRYMKKGKHFQAPSPLRSLETILALLLVCAFYLPRGAAPTVEKSEGTQPLKVALVQRNFPCVFKEAQEEPLAVYSNLFSRVAWMAPDLLLLPESALGEFGPLFSARARAFTAFAREATGSRAVLAGGTRVADGRLYNSAWLESAADDGSLEVSWYDKVHLVPFGEFIPGDKVFPALQKLAPVGSCSAGEAKVLVLDRSGVRTPFGVAICFEDTDSALMRRSAREGARFLAFITNDSWFSHSNEALAHAWQATARAIETGLPVVRVGNSGVTGLVASDGAASFLVGEDAKPLVDESGVMFARLDLSDAPPALTPYVRWGDAPLAVLFLLLVAGLLVLARRKGKTDTTVTRLQEGFSRTP